MTTSSDQTSVNPLKRISGTTATSFFKHLFFQRYYKFVSGTVPAVAQGASGMKNDAGGGGEVGGAPPAGGVFSEPQTNANAMTS